ncbi:MAG: NAD(P)-dependent oxidoreductase [Candidatus Cloacimonetes bacterium]|jgi:nucleoside-diphosphate-sugar epimerase|nr:NAD(P)-dependent oxidoreductase [Candidatus Cloacimonadota bacterium]
MKIAITGANGFAGSNFANYFHSQGNEVRGIVRPQADLSLLDSNLDIQVSDYNSKEELKRILEGMDVLIHNAGAVRTHTFMQMVEANVGTTRRVMEAFNAMSEGKRFIYISSQAASHPTKDMELAKEEEPSAPVDWYGKSKLLAEKIIQTECAKEWVIVRPCSIYGPGEKDFYQVFKAVQKGINFHIGRKPQYMNLIYVRELAQFLELCLTQKNAAGEIFFASDGEIYTQQEFMRLIAEILEVKTVEIAVPVSLAKAAFYAGEAFERITGKTTLLNKQKMKEIIDVTWLCSIDKAKRLLGWNPQPDLKGHLSETINWYKEHNWL